MNTYTYYLRKSPKELPNHGYVPGKVFLHDPVWDSQFECLIYGSVKFNHHLSHQDMEKYGLIADPKNYLCGIRKDDGCDLKRKNLSDSPRLR